MIRVSIKLALKLGRDRPSPAAEEGPGDAGQLDSMVEVANVPERPSLGFLPPSDPSRKTDPDD